MTFNEGMQIDTSTTSTSGGGGGGRASPSEAVSAVW